MASPLLEIQQAIVSVLSTSNIQITGIFDKAPQNQAGPYIVVGEATETAIDVFLRKGKESTITLHIWSTFEGFEEALNILSAVDTVLNYQTLTLPDFTNIYTMYDFSQTLEDPDGIWRQVAVRYRIGTQEGIG